MIPKRRSTRTKDQRKKNVGPKLGTKKKHKKKNMTTGTTQKATRETVLNETLEKTNIRITRKALRKESQKVEKLSSRSLRMIERLKKKDIPVNTTNTYKEKEDSTGESISLNLIEANSISRDETEVPVPRKRKLRVATQEALRAIGKIAKLECSRSKKDDFESYKHIHASEKKDVSKSHSVDTSNIKIPSLPNNTDDIYAEIFDNNESTSMLSEVLPAIFDNDGLSTTSVPSTVNVLEDNNNGSPTNSNLNDITFSHENILINDVKDIIKVFNVPRTIRTSIASKELRSRESNLSVSNHRGWSGMLNLANICTTQLLKAICPGPSYDLLRLQLSEKLAYKEKEQGKKLRSSEQKLNSLLSAIFDAVRNSKKGSIQMKVIRSILCAGIKQKKELRQTCIDYKYTDISNGRSRVDALIDYKKIINGQTLDNMKIYSRKKSPDTVIEDAVKFILQYENVRTFSWGSVDKVISSNETITLPNLQRTTTKTILWQMFNEHMYKKHEQSTNTKLEPHLKRTAFIQICNAITSSEEIVVGSIDYVMSLLLSEPIELMQDIVNKFFLNEEKQKFSTYLNSLTHFLKYTYNKHILIDDDSCTHGLQYGLGRISSSYELSNEIRKEVTCVHCRFPSYVCKTIESKILDSNLDIESDMIQDAITVCKDTETKLHLYMGHKMRCKNQQISIANIEKTMIQRLMDSDGLDILSLVVADFKMKFEPQSSRETTLDHYGKRGIGWHGVHVMYYRLEQVDDNTEKEAVKYSIYLDQILSDGNKQDSMCVFALIDSALMQIKYNLPFINSCIIQTDNAHCYQNNFLICSMALLNAVYKDHILIEQFIHTETQDGKTVLDAHFARCMRFLKVFMKTWRMNCITRINTPNGLGYALAWKGGITNVMVQVVKINRTFVSKLQDTFKPAIEKLKQYFTRVNQVKFLSTSKIHISTGLQDILQQLKKFKFTVGVRSYSDVDQLCTFEVDLSTKDVVTPDAYVMRESNFNLYGDDLRDDPGNTYKSSNMTNTKNQNSSAPTNENNTEEDFTYFSAESEESNQITDSFKKDSDRYEHDDTNVENELFNKFNSTKEMEKRIFMHPNKNIFGVEKLISKTEIIRVMHLDRAKPRKKKGDVKKRNSTKYDKYKNTRNDVTARAIRFAHKLIQEGSIIVKDVEIQDAILNNAENFSLSNEHFAKGWARRVKRDGGLYGRTYIAKYRENIAEFFNKGKESSSDKMNSAQMRESLKIKYPNRFTIPSETEIKQEISALFVDSKNNNKKSNKENKDPIVLNRDEETVDWKNILDSLVQSNISEKPKAIYEKYFRTITQDYHVSIDALPEEKIVKNKISVIRQKHKKKAISGVV